MARLHIVCAERLHQFGGQRRLLALVVVAPVVDLQREFAPYANQTINLRVRIGEVFCLPVCNSENSALIDAMKELNRATLECVPLRQQGFLLIKWFSVVHVIMQIVEIQHNLHQVAPGISLHYNSALYRGGPKDVRIHFAGLIPGVKVVRDVGIYVGVVPEVIRLKKGRLLNQLVKGVRYMQ
jgi:hypothetical protein